MIKNIEPSTISRKNLGNYTRKISKRRNAAEVKSEPTFDYDLSKEYSYTFFLRTSVETLFHYIRFDAFKNVSEKGKKQLLKELCYVECRKPEILKQILNYCVTNNFEGIKELAKENRIDMEKLLEKANTLLKKDKKQAVLQKRPEDIIDGYFMESNQKLSNALIKHLLYMDVSNGKDRMNLFLKKYISTPIQLRGELVDYGHHNAFTV